MVNMTEMAHQQAASARDGFENTVDDLAEKKMQKMLAGVELKLNGVQYSGNNAQVAALTNEDMTIGSPSQGLGA